MLFSGEFRVIQCDETYHNLQSKVLKKNKFLAKDLKLQLQLKKEIQGCQLIGLDGGVKASSKKIFKLETLEALINSMPMRQAELREQGENN